MYVPSDDPDSIDDKDLMGVFVGPVEHYLGFAAATLVRSGKAFMTAYSTKSAKWCRYF